MKIAIIGAGIGGLATAVALDRLGIEADLYERTASFEPIGAGIGLGSNAMLALQKLRVAEDVLEAGMPLHEQRFLNEKLEVMNKIDFSQLKQRFGEETIALQRADLHRALYEAVDPSRIHLNHRVVDFKQEGGLVKVYFSGGKERHFDYVIAADGLHSLFRQRLVPDRKPRYAGYTCWRGITKNRPDVVAHISQEAWASFGRFGWAPMKNGSVYWFACMNASEGNSSYQAYRKADLAQYFSRYSDQVASLILETEDEYFLHHDLYDIRPLRNYVYDRIVLLGDAAHATTPNMGQGAGQAIEDAYVLYEALQEKSSLEAAFQDYEARRWKKAKKVICLSRQIGWAAQWDQGLLVKLRDMIFPYIPHEWLFWRLTFLFKNK